MTKQEKKKKQEAVLRELAHLMEDVNKTIEDEELQISVGEFVQLPNMTKENYLSFDQYVDRVTGRNIDKRPVSECMAEIEEIKKKFM